MEGVARGEVVQGGGGACGPLIFQRMARDGAGVPLVPGLPR